MIEFNKPSITDLERKYIGEALSNGKLCGDGSFTKKVNNWFKDNMDMNNFLLTTSCTHALEMGAMLCDLKPGDEVIVPSYTFVSTINAFMLRGAIPVFVDIDKDTMNIDANLIEEKITSKTKAIFPVHYAGVACDMDKIMSIAKKYNLLVVEDAAQAVGSYYNGKPLGTIGDFGCFSFHETKNYAMGEGGALIVKSDDKLLEAEIIREKGTNRSQFIKGMVDKYTWYDIGSSYLPSDVLAAMLFAQLERFNEIMEKRLNVWNKYNQFMEKYEKEGIVQRPFIPSYATNNAHMYYIILESNQKRDKVMEYLKKNDIISTFHYIPLHLSPMGKKLGYKSGDLKNTEDYSSRLLRLPLWADMTEEQIDEVCKKIKECL